MKQLFQSLKTGKVKIEELPVPYCAAGYVLIQTTRTLVSLGTEKMLLNFGKANLINKVRQQPEKVQQVLTKVKTDGLTPTFNAVRNKLGQPLPLGYSSVGVVVEVGKNVNDLKPGDRVVSNAPHAEFASVSRNLVAKIPEHVSDESASFTVVGAIGLQGIRLLTPSFGETIVVVGLGLIGLLTVQLLRANGCQVIGFDFDEEKVNKAKSYGAKAFVVSETVDPVAEALNQTNGVGVDGVIITASTRSNDVISQAAQMTRVRGKVILVGVVGLDIKRSDFYEKEITFQVSCSYGPGRYDPKYEDMGIDYPIGFARWTEQRNFEAVLQSLEEGTLIVEDLITRKVDFQNAPELYSGLGSQSLELGIIISYGEEVKELNKSIYYEKSSKSSSISVSMIGAGQFAGAVLLPAFEKSEFEFQKIGSRSSGAMAPHLREKFKFEELTSDYDRVLEDKGVRNVVITTRHNSHGALVIRALKNGKNVFVEKPLALSMDEVDEIENFYKKEGFPKPLLMVGFNRRFSPLAQELKKTLKKSSASRAFVMTINAGAIPKDHWTQDATVGGGRLIGEGCHFIDLLRFLSDSKIVDSSVSVMKSDCKDTFSIQLEFENGDIGTIHYFANGNKSFSKERLEVFVGGKIIVLDNFKKLTGIGLKSIKYALKSQDKGHLNEVKAFKEGLESGSFPIPLEEILEISRCSITLQEKIRNL
ncbi:bi-domain-containing oxidoreductase [Halobacteriovorax sp. JY17]|uniref:bi-domain-containing oxidoreductase n=1 Tax=Halobacteriovorax sp. JY17 TaxID=2014617 RepID=UPI000C3FA465|nr:bi-domain-containing oxidoreductase [Halobacteriovorax sp. JY17]PIK14686.1 MAG: dehydrogenase [Halobacteriovorax sp. JY17]